MNFKKCFVVLVFMTIVAVGSSFATCTDLTVNGVWGFWLGAAAGQFTADGTGHITAGSATISESGTILNITFTGTYSVAKNCTGSMNLNIKGGGTETLNFVLDQANKGVQLISTVSGNNDLGFGAAEGTFTCGLTGVKKTYAAFLIGKINSSNTKVDYVMQLILNGTGKVSGSGTFDVGGTISTGSISGTYTENSNCLGTMTITGGGVTLNLDFDVAAAGKEVFAIESDNNTSVAGFMLQ